MSIYSSAKFAHFLGINSLKIVMFSNFSLYNNHVKICSKEMVYNTNENIKTGVIMKTIPTLCIILFVFFYQIAALAKPSWELWVSELKEEAISEGIDPNLFDQLFANISAPDQSVEHFSHHQPEHRINYPEYKNTRADTYKIIIGRREYKKHQSILQSVAHSYNVNACYIVALWGMETSYGRYMGKFPVIKSLATLAYQSNRQAKFRSELLYALHMLNDHQVSIEQFKGEWAGATGQPQFLPSSWVKYAVDYDKCGRKNIWTSYPDVFASIANYLVKNNWNNAEPIMIPVALPEDFDTRLIGTSMTKPVSTWNKLGVHATDGGSLPYSNLQASLIKPDGDDAYLIYPNFKVLLSYNNSIYYAGTIKYLADEICQKQKVD